VHASVQRERKRERERWAGGVEREKTVPLSQTDPCMVLMSPKSNIPPPPRPPCCLAKSLLKQDAMPRREVEQREHQPGRLRRASAMLDCFIVGCLPHVRRTGKWFGVRRRGREGVGCVRKCAWTAGPCGVWAVYGPSSSFAVDVCWRAGSEACVRPCAITSTRSSTCSEARRRHVAQAI